MRALKDISCGEKVNVIRINAKGPLKRRIMDMGITKGTELTVKKVAQIGRAHV